ncbi:MAG: hypothetical protein WCB27_09020 [Thermoguttaceae bacterium]
MLRKSLLVSATVMALFAAVQAASADVYVHGYIRSNGTYVQPYYRSNPDGNFWNNWSTYPNINPYTGNVGTRYWPSYNYGNFRSFSYPSYRLPSYRSYNPYIRYRY